LSFANDPGGLDQPVLLPVPRGSTVSVGGDAFGNILLAGNDNTVTATVTIVVADPGMVEKVLRAARPSAPVAAAAAAPLPNPYRALEPFRGSDAEWFFGRSALVRVAWSKLRALEASRDPRILAVLGVSGSGKSSLVRAGLLPELARNPITQLKQPVVALLRPHAAPLENLARVLARLPGIAVGTDAGAGAATGLTAAIERRLCRAGPQGFDGLLAIAQARPDAEEARLLVVVDQFEELFTTCEDAAAIHTFLENLAFAASAPDGGVSVILTLRSDFAGLVETPEPFAKAVRGDNPVLVRAMDRAELCDAIERPAELLGHPWDRELVGSLVAQAEGRAGALPLLQFALHKLWPDHAAGRLKAAQWTSQLIEDHLKAAAETEYVQAGQDAEHGEANQRIIRRTFLAMVQLGEGVPDTRRVARLAEIVAPGEDAARVRKAMARFIHPDTRLVSVSDEADGPRYEMTHEALIQSWKRLRDWLGQVAGKAEGERIRAALRLRRQIAEAAAQWRRRRGGLWRPPELDRMLAPRAPDEPDPTAEEIAFAAASLRAWRRTRLLRLLTGLAGVVLVAVVLLAGKLYQDASAEAATAADEARRQASRRLAVLATAETEAGNGMAGMLLALEALSDRRDVPEAENALRQAVFENRELRRLPHAVPAAGKDPVAVTAVAVAPDGRILTGGDDGRLLAWDAAGAPAGEWPALGKAVTRVVLSPDPAGPILVVYADPDMAVLWDRRPGGRSRPLSGAAHQIRAAEFSRDGRVVVGAMADGSAVLWLASGGEALRGFPSRDAAAVAVTISDDLTRLLIVTQDGKARLWDVRTGKEIRTLQEVTEHVVAASFTAQDTMAATVAADGALRLWDVTAPAGGFTPLRRFPPVGAPGAEVMGVDFNAARTRLAAAYADGTVRLREVETGAPIGLPLPEAEGRVDRVAFGPGDRLVATLVTKANPNNPAASPVRIWDAGSGRLVASLRGHVAPIRAMALHPDGARLVTGAEDGTAGIWDMRDDRSTAALTGYRRRLRELGLRLPQQLAGLGLDDRPFAFAADGRVLAAAAGPENGLLVWEPGGEASLQAGGASPVSAVAATADSGLRAMIGRFDGTVQFWGGGRAPVEVGRHAAAVSAIAASDDGRRFLSVALDGTARLWNGGEGAPGPQLAGHAGPILAATFTPDGRLAATAAADGTARLWNAESGVEVARFEHGAAQPPPHVLTVAFSPDGTRVLTAAADGRARLWTVGAPTDAPLVLVHDGMLRSAAFDPSGRFIVTVCDDGAAHLWRTADGFHVGTRWRRNGAAIDAAAFVPGPPQPSGAADQQYVVTAAEDGVVEVWAGPLPVLTLRGHVGAVTAIGFDRAGRQLLTASADGSLRLWRILLATEELAAEARRRRTRSLTATERNSYDLPAAPLTAGGGP
jgi:WD40 repeat protein